MMRGRAALLAAALVLTGCEVSSPPSSDRPGSEAGRPSASSCDPDVLARRMRRGFVPGRSPDVLLVPKEPNYIGTAARPVHTGPWEYLVKVPLVFYGPGLIEPRGSVGGDATVADIAPTLASVVGYESPHKWDGKVLREVVAGEPRPRVVVVVVLDGVGRNVLEEHRGAAPFLRKMRAHGVDYAEAEVGSSPSNTPPIHTTIGTGVFPRRHGIPHVQVREGDTFVDPFEGNNADSVAMPSLADLYDAVTSNEPLIGLAATVNWHLGMIGHGMSYPGGDLDEAVLLNDQGEQYGDATTYALPAIADPAELQRLTSELDAEDGNRDGLWRGEDLSDPALRYMSPAFVRYEQSMLERLLERGYGRDDVTDLVYVNMKAADTAGHRWGMTSSQVGELVRAEDEALRDTAAFLDREVGRDRWLLVVTADHGQTPYPEESGAWPIRGGEVKSDLQAEFGEAAIQRVTSAGVFLSAPSDGVKVARWLGDYSVGDNVVEGEEVPSAWRDREEERVFDIVMAGPKVVVDHCAG